MSWIEVSLDTTHEAIDWVNTLLATTPYQGDVHITRYVAIDDKQLIQANELKELNASNPQAWNDREATMAEWEFTVQLYIPNHRNVRAQIEMIERLFSPLHRTGMTTLPQVAVLEEKPEATETPNIPRYRIGQRFVVVPEIAPTAVDRLPTKDSTDSVPNLISLQLPATRAFGSGLHPTTIISLRLLERHVSPGNRVLDFGSGSGILAVAIAKLGATVLALDNDEVAVAATQSMVRLNGVASQVRAVRGSLGTGSALGHWMGGELAEPVPAIDTDRRFAQLDFDLVVANVPGRIHLALVEQFYQSLRPAGLLIAAGFTSDYETELSDALTQIGFTLIDWERSGEWVALVGQLTATHR